MEAFEYNQPRIRVVFGSGSIASLPLEAKNLGMKHVFLVSGPTQTHLLDRAAAIFHDAASGSSSPAVAGTCSYAVQHSPLTVTDRALRDLQSTNADGIVAVGGGSPIGLAKALALRTNLPHIAVPTTYAGSEMTSTLGQTGADGVKRTTRDDRIRPSTVIYDVELTLTLPSGLTATSGVNALAHAVEALYAPDKSPIVSLFALEGIRALASALPRLAGDGQDRHARSAALYGAYLCGICAGQTKMGLQHKLAHTVGGTFGLDHAGVHTRLLPHSVAYNAPDVPRETWDRLAEVLPGSEGDAIKGLNVLVEGLGIDKSLRSLGLKEADIPKAAEQACLEAYPNPRPLERDLIQTLLWRAWAGEEARADF